MKTELSVEERDLLFQSLSDEQRHFLDHEMLRSRRTVFAQTMARAKGAEIPEGASYEDVERFLDGWIYIGYTDAGMVSSEFPCDCGRPLRYRHRVKHKVTGQTMYFGIVHLGEHLKLDAKTVLLIKKGFDVLDREMDEMLVKVREKWAIQTALSVPIPAGFPFPNDIRAHLDVRLPLLDRQVVRLRKKIIDFIDQAAFGRDTAPKRNDPPVAVAPDIFVKPEQATILFPGESPVETRSVPDMIDRHTSMNFIGSEVLLEIGLESKVEDLLRSGVQSARVIAEILIGEGAADQRRYSSKKPHLFIPVCMYIDSELIPRGHCRLIGKTSDDRLYAWDS